MVLDSEIHLAEDVSKLCAEECVAELSGVQNFDGLQGITWLSFNIDLRRCLHPESHLAIPQANPHLSSTSV